MFDYIRLSRYIKEDSIIHKLNSINKLMSLLLILIISVISDSLLVHLCILIYIIFTIILTKIRLKEYLLSLKNIRYLLIGILIINLLLNVNIYINIINILRIIELVLYTSVITISTSEVEILYGINKILFPFKIIGINTSKISFILSLALKFIPKIMDQVNMIMFSLSSKGIDFKKNKHKLLIMKSIIIPTFNLSMRAADNFSDSLIVRHYDFNKDRNIYTYNKWTFIDSINIIILLFLLLIEVIL